jgi:DNA-binding transcriptional regulator YiaG
MEWMPPKTRHEVSEEQAMPSVQTMIDCIRQAFNWSEEALGKWLDVSQPSISRWYNGDSNPTGPHLTKLIALYERGKQHLSAALIGQSEFEYICSFASRYTDTRADEGLLALQEILPQPFSAFRTENVGGIHIDFFIRAAKLSPGVRAHTFQERKPNPRVFVVLVSETLGPTEQLQVAWDEAFAHVITRMIDASKTVKHPRPIIGPIKKGGKQ